MGRKSKTEKKQKAGRPSDFRDIYVEMGFKFSLLGADDEKLAELLGTSIGSLSRWKKSNRKFREAIKKGKDYADAKVAEALYNRATGFIHKKALKLFYNKDLNKVIRARYALYYPPDTAAAFIWLKNRQGWKNESSGGENNKGAIAAFMDSLRSDEQGDEKTGSGA